ncbi:MAG: hypothetical protein R3C49_02530 [Planctomycetaceae bacterium]
MRLAYFILLCASGVVTAIAIRDIWNEQQESNERARHTAYQVPTSVAATDPTEHFELDPEIRRRIDEVLSEQAEPLLPDTHSSEVPGTEDEVQPSATRETETTEVPRSPSSENAVSSVRAASISEIVAVPEAARSVDHLNDINVAADLVTKEMLPKTRTDEGIRHSAPQHPQMLTPGNFLYLGAFRPPHYDANQKNFAYGGCGLAYRDNGDPDGPDDGFPGSLYLMGGAKDQLVAEITIPKPVISREKKMDDLTEAEVLQPLGDITGGIRAQMSANVSEPFEIGGLHYTDARLHWTLFKFYNVVGTDYLSHGSSSPFIRHPLPEGPWHLGPQNSGISEWHSYKHAGYIFEVPEVQAGKWLGGRNLISGLQFPTGLNVASHGPAMFAYKLPPPGTPAGKSLNAVPLVYNDIATPAPDFHPADLWTGGAWLTAGDRHAVIIVGRKSLGPLYYGDARPQDCTPDKGYHGSPYESQVLFYAPEALARAASGSLDPRSIRPWYVWSGQTPGGAFGQYLFETCSHRIGGVTYDRARNLLYLTQHNAGKTRENEFEPLPAIHVFRIVL